MAALLWVLVGCSSNSRRRPPPRRRRRPLVRRLRGRGGVEELARRAQERERPSKTGWMPLTGALTDVKTRSAPPPHRPRVRCSPRCSRCRRRSTALETATSGLTTSNLTQKAPGIAAALTQVATATSALSTTLAQAVPAASGGPVSRAMSRGRLAELLFAGSRGERVSDQTNVPQRTERHEDVDRDRQVPEHRQDRHEQPDEDHHDVDAQGRCAPLGECLHVLVTQIGPHEPGADGVPPGHRHHDHGQEQVDPVHGRRDPFGVSLLGVLGQQPCVKGRNETTRSSKRFSRMSTESAWSRYSVITVCANQTAPMVAKLTV